MAVVANDILALINGNLGFVTDTNLFRGYLRGPDELYPQYACFVRVYGSVEPINFGTTGSPTSPQEQHVMVQLLFRGNMDDYAGNYAAAVALQALVHDVSPGATYFRCRAQNSEPLHLGIDTNGGDLFSINLRVSLLE